MTTLPESLLAKPNIPWNKQTNQQLVQERDYWQRQIDLAGGWGAAVGAATEFRDACQAELNRRNYRP